MAILIRSEKNETEKCTDILCLDIDCDPGLEGYGEATIIKSKFILVGGC